jgi:hypothetical protein
VSTSLENALTAAADALDLRVQEPVALGRGCLDMFVIGALVIGREGSTAHLAMHACMHSVAAVKTATEAMSATGLGRRREAKRQA